jgi:hypothetical protein
VSAERRARPFADPPPQARGRRSRARSCAADEWRKLCTLVYVARTWMACAFRRSASLFDCRKRIYFWRGGQGSGTGMRRENNFICVGGTDSPLPAARGEVEGAKRPRVRGPLRDSEWSGWRNGAVDLGREARPGRNAPLTPTLSPRGGEREKMLRRCRD